MDAFIGEIRAFGFSFVPEGWLLCDGSLLSIPQYAPLYSVIGPYYGGDGQTNFRVPNLNARAPLGAGSGPGLTQWQPGESPGETLVRLSVSQIPSHDHDVTAVSPVAGSQQTAGPVNQPYLGRALSTKADGTSVASRFYSRIDEVNTTLSPSMISPAGAGEVHDNLQPYLPIQYCINWNGTFPQRP